MHLFISPTHLIPLSSPPIGAQENTRVGVEEFYLMLPSEESFILSLTVQQKEVQIEVRNAEDTLKRNFLTSLNMSTLTFFFNSAPQQNRLHEQPEQLYSI